MTLSTLPCFHSESLRQDFSRHLLEALAEARLTQDEVSLLDALTQSPWQPLTQLRLDTLSAPGWHNREFADALMITSLDTDIPTAYLLLPLRGVERFNDRHSLHVALDARYGEGASQPGDISAEQLDTSPFDRWMDTQLQQHKAALLGMQEAMGKLPTLHSVVETALRDTLARLSPIADTEPADWAWQVTTSASDDTVLRVRRLVDVAMDAFCGVATTEGDEQLRLLDPDGNVLASSVAQDYRATFGGAMNRLNAPFAKALERWWERSALDGQDMPGFAAKVLAQAFYLALLKARHARRLPAADLAWLSSALVAEPARKGNAGVLLERISLHSGQRVPIELAGAFTLRPADAPNGAFYLYSVRTGLQHFRDTDTLGAWLVGDARQTFVKEAIGRQNHEPYKQMKGLQAQLSALSGNAFEQAVQDLQDVQRDNLAAAIAQRKGDAPTVAAQLAEAMDLRGPLAPVLLSIDATSDSPTDDSPDPESVEAVDLHFRNLLSLQTSWRLIKDAQPRLRDCLETQLRLYLAICDAAQWLPGSVWIAPNAAATHAARTTAAATPADNRQTLSSYAIQRLGAQPPAPLTSDAVITATDGTVIAQLDARLLNHAVTGATGAVTQAWITQTSHFNNRTTRLGDRVIEAHEACVMLRQRALREELFFTSLSKECAWASEWLRQVLDYPTHAQRAGFGTTRVNASRLALQLPGNASTMVLSNTLVLTLASAPQGKQAFCSHRLGVIGYDTAAQLASDLNTRLRSPRAQDSWLALVAEQYRPALIEHLHSEPATALAVSQTVVEGEATQYLQRSDEHRQLLTTATALARARQDGYPGKLLLDYVDQTSGALALGEQLDELTTTAHARELQQRLPAWLRDASEAELIAYKANLVRVQASLSMPTQYLFGIETAQEFAREQLWTTLDIDFPGEALNPEHIRVRVAQRFKTGLAFGFATEGMVTSAAGVAYPLLEMTLVDYSLQRAMTAPGLPIEVVMADGTALTQGLDVHYVTSTVETLDTGGHYLQRLTRQFSPLNDDYPKRRALFHQQVPPLLMDAALEAKLKGELSASAFSLVEALLEMPDPDARHAQQNQHYWIRPLSLLAAEGLKSDSAAGLYLLGTASPTQGPVVVLATFDEDFVYREFRNEVELMTALRTPGALQDLVLQRLDDKVRSRYAHGGFTEPHFRLGEDALAEQPLPRPWLTRLSFEPVHGNTVNYLFEESLHFIQRLAKAQVVTSEQMDQAITTGLLKRIAENGLSLPLARLALVQCLWQSAEWIKESAQSLVSREWGRAVTYLGAALITLAIHRKARTERPMAEALTPLHDELAQSAWTFSQLSQEVRARLRGLQASDVVLATLTADQEPGIWIDAATTRRYAAVAGQVFQVRKLEGRWTIVGEQREGPGLRRNAKGYWEMLIAKGLAGGGGGWSRQRSAARLRREVDAVFTVEATGMTEIRQHFPSRAVRLSLARQRAKRYLERCMDVLKAPGQPLAPTTRSTLEAFFSVTAPSPALVQDVRDSAAAIFAELMDNSLNTRTSKRYVIGMNKPGFEGTVAFTSIKDPRRRIYFGEPFFDIPHVLRTSLRASQKHFDVAAHFRATSLIHELSHLAIGTEDLAYVEASAPYIDLIDATHPDGPDLIKLLNEAQSRTLTAQTPEAQLFTVEENGIRRDLDSSDGDSYKRILALSKCKTLKEARVAFLGNEEVRRKIILANADSAALLMSLLARKPGMASGTP